MKIKTTLAAFVLAVAPTLSFAACWEGHSQQAMSCAEGQVWDETSEACVEATA
jgi:hypothetical protein